MGRISPSVSRPCVPRFSKGVGLLIFNSFCEYQSLDTFSLPTEE